MNTTMIFRRRLLLCSPKSISSFKLGLFFHLYLSLPSPLFLGLILNDTEFWFLTVYSAHSSASAHDDDAEAPITPSKVKGRRVPKAQRQAMIQAFVYKYDFLKI